MSEEVIVKAQAIKEALRNVINQIFEEEFDIVIQKIIQNEAIMTTRSVEEIIRDILGSY